MAQVEYGPHFGTPRSLIRIATVSSFENVDIHGWYNEIKALN